MSINNERRDKLSVTDDDRRYSHVVSEGSVTIFDEMEMAEAWVQADSALNLEDCR